jgi:type VII secretion integral membrane protein EccD
VTAGPLLSTPTGPHLALPGGDPRCRVTVVGERRRVDLALPAHAPVAEYALALARMCGQAEDELLPAAWSLAVTGRPPLPLTASLAAAGITDGAVLHLRDVLVGEADEAVVRDIEEEVTEASARFGTWPWDRRHRAVSLMAAAALWLVAAVVTTAVTVPRDVVVQPVLLAALAAVAAVSVAWTARRRSWPVPLPVRALTALVAVPALAIAGERLAGAHPAGGALALDTAVGAAVGAVAVFAAAPGIFTAALPPVALVGVVAVTVLGALRADTLQATAFTTVLVLGLFTLTPWAAGRVAAYSVDERRLEQADAETLDALVRQSRWLLVTASAVLATVLGVTLVLLARSADPYAQALAGCAAVALLARADGFGLVAEAFPALLAAAAGLLALVFEVPERFSVPWWTGPLAATAVGLVLLLSATSTTARGRRPGKARPGGHAVLEFLCSTATAALAVGVFGVYGRLVTMGHGL